MLKEGHNLINEVITLDCRKLSFALLRISVSWCEPSSIPLKFFKKTGHVNVF